MSKFVVENNVQAALFVGELVGQFSDGFWENHMHNGSSAHWRPWSNAEVEVAKEGEDTGRDFYAEKDNYNLSAKMLLECVGDRMVLYARMGRAGVKAEDVHKLEYAFGSNNTNEDGKIVFELNPGGPTYCGASFDKVRMYVKSFPKGTLETIANDTAFDMPELKHELFLLKKVMKKRLK